MRLSTGHGLFNACDHVTKMPAELGWRHVDLDPLCDNYLLPAVRSPSNVGSYTERKDRSPQETEAHRMRNDECIIYITNKSGEVLQTYQRVNNRWVQTSRNGAVRLCTAEQLLSHILPSLAGVSPARVRVESRVVSSDSKAHLRKAAR